MMRKQMHRQVLLLASTQALFQTASVMVITVGGLAGAVVAQSPQFATLPIAAMFMGTAITTVPASIWMNRIGRKYGFISGAVAGTLGGLISAAGIWLGSLSVLCLGTVLVGVYQAFAQFYRFAAGEIADESFRSRAISLVLAGGIVAALMGPLLGRYGSTLFEPAYSGSFILLSLASLAATALLLLLRTPPSIKGETTNTESSRPLSAILKQPAYLVALFGAATGYGVMILAMTATPIAMLHHHHDLADAAFVIQLHVLGMFLPSFFTGSLIARFGVVQVMLAGVALLTGHVLLTLTGFELNSFISALIFLGIGWNFLYVGGTTLLTRCYSPSEAGRAQGINDMSIFVVGLAASLSAGILFKSFGWQLLNILLLPWLAVAALALLWFARTQLRNEPRG